MPSAAMKCFLISIDTEGDSLWTPGKAGTTRNAAFLARFQALCERYGFRPTWLTDYTMAGSPVFGDFARDVLDRDAAEIGMHLHAWDTPPEHRLSGELPHDHTYLPEYPVSAMRAKLQAVTDRLTDLIGRPPRSHRAGRWGFDARYAVLLAEMGYWVDCSVTPGVTWHRQRGVSGGSGGPDFRDFPSEAYFLDLTNIRRAGHSSLLEVPMTIMPRGGVTLQRWLPRAAPFAAEVALRKLVPDASWLRPDGHNLSDMVSLCDRALEQGRDYIEFMLHSSELMPGGSPRFATERSIERLYEDLDGLFAHVARSWQGATLTEYYERFSEHAMACSAR